MWVLIIVTYFYNPGIARTHYDRKVEKQYYSTEEECLTYRDLVAYKANSNRYLSHAEVGCVYQKGGK
jgi:hypothetical protein